MGAEDNPNPLARHGGLSYLELPAGDAARSGAFYGAVLGWQVDGVRFASKDGLTIGRFTGEALTIYVYVEDLAAAVAAATANGGSVVEAIRPEGNVRVARVRDPGGNVIGLWQFA